jgi:hypothetical protein
MYEDADAMFVQQFHMDADVNVAPMLQMLYYE